MDEVKYPLALLNNLLLGGIAVITLVDLALSDVSYRHPRVRAQFVLWLNMLLALQPVVERIWSTETT